MKLYNVITTIEHRDDNGKTTGMQCVTGPAIVSAFPFINATRVLALRAGEALTVRTEAPEIGAKSGVTTVVCISE